MNTAQAYPVRIEGELDPNVSRWLWLVKWLLAIPHYIALALLWLTVLVLTTVAFFAILVTGRYPRGIFDFNLGVFRWTWRVAFYSYAALGTDRYPPFTLRDLPDYPARLDIEYPEQLSRGLVLVKSWLLAIPHYVVVGILVGGGYLVSRADGWDTSFYGGLISVLVIFSGVAMLFTTRYPRGSFDLVVGLDRWVARVAAYVFLMRDEYPPFRLDQGGLEGGATSARRVSVTAGTSAPLEHGVGRIVGRAASLVLGVVSGLMAVVLLVGGGALIAIDRTQRDGDGFLTSPKEGFASSTYAIVSERTHLDTEGAERLVDVFLGDARIRGASDRALFIGIGHAAAVNRYLAGVEHDVVGGFEDSEPTYERQPGDAPRGAPAEQGFWDASTSGLGEQSVDWDVRRGDWRVVVMNADGSRGVSADLSVGAQLDSVFWFGVGLMLAGAVQAVGAAFAIGYGARRED